MDPNVVKRNTFNVDFLLSDLSVCNTFNNNGIKSVKYTLNSSPNAYDIHLINFNNSSSNKL